MNSKNWWVASTAPVVSTSAANMANAIKKDAARNLYLRKAEPVAAVAMIVVPMDCQQYGFDLWNGIGTLIFPDLAPVIGIEIFGTPVCLPTG